MPALPEYCLFWIDHWPMCMSKAEWSGWVQAIGSVLAVLAGAIAVWWQVHKQARMQGVARTNDETRLLRIVGQFVFEVRAKLRFIEEEELPHLHGDWYSIDAPIASIRAVAFDRYPVEHAAFAVASALLSYGFMRDAHRKSDSILSLDQVVHRDKSRQHALTMFFRAESEIEAALVKRGSNLVRMEIGFGEGLVIRTLEVNPVPET